jgi:hypothetical protein
MAGSFGNVTPGFMSQMWQAMHGRFTVPVATDWSQVEPIHALWPSRSTALTMNLAAVISFRAIPAHYWTKLPVDAKNRFFFDAPPNPPHKQPTFGYCCNAHAKVLLTKASTHSLVYIGSHNLSKSAWGEAGEQPKNIELGVLLGSCNEKLRQEWVDRLPCALPDAASLSTTAAERDDYFPASAPYDIRKLAESESETPGAADKAIEQIKAYLASGQWPLTSGARSSGDRQQMRFALVWIDRPDGPPLLYLDEGARVSIGRELIKDRLPASGRNLVSREQAELLVKDGGVQVLAAKPFDNRTGVSASADSEFDWLYSGATRMLYPGARIALRAGLTPESPNYKCYDTLVREGCVLMVISVAVSVPTSFPTKASEDFRYRRWTKGRTSSEP